MLWERLPCREFSEWHERKGRRRSQQHQSTTQRVSGRQCMLSAELHNERRIKMNKTCIQTVSFTLKNPINTHFMWHSNSVISGAEDGNRLTVPNNTRCIREKQCIQLELQGEVRRNVNTQNGICPERQGERSLGKAPGDMERTHVRMKFYISSPGHCGGMLIHYCLREKSTPYENR